MPTSGGLKFALQPATPDDRRVRFVQAELSKVGWADAVPLITDARGRMRCRLADGDYRLALDGGPATRFAVRDHRWTTVRIKLT